MSGALESIPEHYKTEFANNWENEVQQKTSRLKEYATSDTVGGKEKSYNVFGRQEMQRITIRAGQTRHQDVDTEKYWLRPVPYDCCPKPFDEWDQEYLGSIVLPKSEVLQGHVSAYNRTADSIIALALGGDRYIGEHGTTADPLPSSQKVAVDYKGPGVTPANTGLTLAKLIAGRGILAANEVLEDGEMPVLAVAQAQINDMLFAVDQVSNADYANIKALAVGDVTSTNFMGMRWKRLESLPLSASDIRSCYLYVKAGVKFADSGRKSYMDVLPTQSHALQIRTTASMGATRTQNEYVVEIACDQSP